MAIVTEPDVVHVDGQGSAAVASSIGEQTSQHEIAVAIATDIEAHEFGPQNLRSIAYTELNLVSQMRQLYEDEPLEELAASIDLEGLMHQLTVAELTPQACQDYLDGINRVWGSQHTIDQLSPNETGNFYIVIAGHRRYFAIGRLIEKNGWQPGLQTVVSNVHHEIQPYDALLKQMNENVMAPPKPYEFAYAIRELYEVGLLEGLYDSVNGFSKLVPFNAQRIYAAVRYCMLPGKVRQMVETNFLSYTASLELVPLLQAYVEREDPSDVIDEEVFTAAVRLSVENMTQTMAHTFIQGRVDALLSGQGDLGMIMEEAADDEAKYRIEQARSERRQIIKQFSTNAIGGLSNLLSLSERGLLGQRDIVLDTEQIKMHMQSWEALLRRLITTAGAEELEPDLFRVEELTELLPGQEVLVR